MLNNFALGNILDKTIWSEEMGGAIRNPALPRDMETIARHGKREVRAILSCQVATQLHRPGSIDHPPTRRYRVLCPRHGDCQSSARASRFSDDRFEFRSLRATPLVMIVADRAAAMFCGTSLNSRVVTHDVNSISLAVAFFDALWRNSATAEPPIAGLAQRQDAILNCLSQGMTDSATAARLDVCERTIRREINGLMRALDVSSRFQLGLRVQALGWAPAPQRRGTR